MDQAHAASGSKTAEPVTRTLHRRSLLRIVGGAVGAVALSQFAINTTPTASSAESTPSTIQGLTTISKMPPAPASTATPTHVEIFDISPTPTASALNNVNLDGLLIKARWSTVEPSEGVFNWSSVDNLINQLPPGKFFELSAPAGAYAPSWVYTDLAQRFSFIWDQPFTFSPCSTQSIPIPWDSIYTTKYEAFIDALASRYASNPRLLRVKATGVNSETDELFLPHATGQTIRGKCNSNNDVANWNSVGYTQTLVVDAFTTFATYISQAFPNLPVDAMIASFGFPNDGRIPPGTVETAIIAACADIWRCGMQNNGWGVNMVPLTGMKVYQEWTALGTGLATAIPQVLAVNPVALEIADSDIVLTANQTALAQAHNTP